MDACGGGIAPAARRPHHCAWNDSWAALTDRDVSVNGMLEITMGLPSVPIAATTGGGEGLGGGGGNAAAGGGDGLATGDGGEDVALQDLGAGQECCFC